MYPVNVRIDENGRPLSGHFYEITARMMAMREWLDHHGFGPLTFTYMFMPPGIAFQVHFKSVEEATKFSRAFNGRIMAPFADARLLPRQTLAGTVRYSKRKA